MECMQNMVVHQQIHTKKQSVTRALSSKSGVTLWLSVGQLSVPDKLRLTETHFQRIARAKACVKGVHIKLYETQIGKQGGFGRFGASMLVYFVAPMVRKTLGLGQG